MTEWLLRCFIKGYKGDIDSLPSRSSIGSLAGWVGICCNLLLAAGKTIVGLVAGSVSALADGLNNLLDAAGSLIALIGFKISAQAADQKHPFGHGRYEYISGLAVSVLVLVIGIELGKSSVAKIMSPTPVDFAWWSFIILIVAILLKLWLFFFNQKIGRQIQSKALQATAIDSLGDVLATSAVLLSALLVRFADVNLDGWIGTGVAAFIIYNGIKLIISAIGPLVGESPPEEMARAIIEKIESYKYVLDAHDLIVHDYGPSRRFASVHVEMPSSVDVMAAHEVIDRMQKDFMKDDNIHLIVHYDPIDTDEATNRLRHWVEKQVQAIDKRLRVHDLRVAEKDGQTCCRFKVVTPPGLETTEIELVERIKEVVRRDDMIIRTEITINRSFFPRENLQSDTQ
ncbi:MAG TPA: cation transporter [Clostridiales bacterium]|jgi:cation diffusion facilitator family transporter|nr:cation transporter [Clostridiales bacterium]